MGEIFTFAGLINHSHGFVFLFHIFLVAGIVFILAKLATAKMQLVPSGVQNVMEASYNQEELLLFLFFSQ